MLARAEIHKGAVALEQIAACFHELASASDAVVNAQRKLSKVLKDTAASKGCPDLSRSALQASAWIWDSLSDPDSKYAASLEREYESLSTEMRRWFKKLAKDEREHDNFVATREARIRQAGEAYERRALRKDIAEEYSRYVDILNVLGSEISAAENQHLEGLNSRHTKMMIMTGASLTRLADAAWVRVCGSVRQCAAGVGEIGTARAWCESGVESTSFYGEGEDVEPRPAEEYVRPAFPDSNYRPPSYMSNSPTSPAKLRTTSLPPPEHGPGPDTAPTSAESSSFRAAESQISLKQPASSSSSSPGTSRTLAGVSNKLDDGNPKSSRSNEYNDAGSPRTSLRNNLRDDPSADRAPSRASHRGSPLVQTRSFTPTRQMTPTSLLPPDLSPSANSSAFEVRQRRLSAASSTSPGARRALPQPRLSDRPLLSESGDWFRPGSSNLPTNRPPSWVGKGLRRLSMPSFASSR